MRFNQLANGLKMANKEGPCLFGNSGYKRMVGGGLTPHTKKKKEEIIRSENFFCRKIKNIK
jgi:hypothetical protein